MTTITSLRSVPFELSDAARGTAAERLNAWLPDLIALSLRLKQAHWNLRGSRFKSVHEQLDEILVDVRQSVDDVAERVVTIGAAADGRLQTVAASSTLGGFPAGQLTVEQAIEASCAGIAGTIRRGRSCLATLGEVDPISEDLAIGVIARLEKHHWMLQSQAAST